MNAWACSKSKMASRRAEDLLKEMEKYGDDVSIPRPDIITYNTAIKALNQGTEAAAVRAEELLHTLEHRGIADVYTYAAVIFAYGSSDAPNKDKKAFELLQRMLHSFDDGNSTAKQNIVPFNAALNACAFVRGDIAAKLDAFDTLVSVFGLLKEYAKPDHTTYGTVLRACSSLLPPSDDRRELVVDSIFRQACQDGLVGKMVLTQLRFAASSDQFHKLTGLEKDAKEVSIADLPRSWTCNVREKR